MEDNKDLGKLFKERLANAEAEPSGALWSQIENTLDKKRKRRGFLWIWMGALLLLTLSSIVYFGILNDSVPESNQSSETPSSVTDIQQKNKPQNYKLM